MWLLLLLISRLSANSSHFIQSVIFAVKYNLILIIIAVVINMMTVTGLVICGFLLLVYLYNALLVFFFCYSAMSGKLNAVYSLTVCACVLVFACWICPCLLINTWNILLNVLFIFSPCHYCLNFLFQKSWLRSTKNKESCCVSCSPTLWCALVYISTVFIYQIFLYDYLPGSQHHHLFCSFRCPGLTSTPVTLTRSCTPAQVWHANSAVWLCTC